MKKYNLLLAVLLACITPSFAQVTFVSTLQHGGTFSHFYGSTAFSSAYEAAADGDTITLSGGNFTFSGNFSKGVTVRGTGTASDIPSVIRSNMNFYSQNSGQSAVFEGVFFNNVVNVYNSASEQGQGRISFVKCLFWGEVNATNSDSYSTEKGPETRFVDCILRSRMYFYKNSYPYFSFVNCYVYAPHCESGISSNLTVFENCVINYRKNVTGVYPNAYYDAVTKGAYYLSFYNSIFVFDNYYNNGHLPSEATAQNCLSVNNTSCFNYVYNNGTNKNIENVKDVFKTYESGYETSDNYALTENAAATYLGTDGTEIGVNGGHAPFTQTVQYPVVTTLKANHTDKDGKLNVEVGIDE